MNARDDGGPAFPFTDSASPLESPGMSLRDYFAAKALQGYWANPSSEFPSREAAAECMYGMADVMLKARNT